LLTAAIFELDLEDRSVTRASVSKHVPDSRAVALLNSIAKTGGSARDERDLKFHRGVEREFDEDGLYHSISILELLAPLRADRQSMSVDLASGSSLPMTLEHRRERIRRTYYDDTVRVPVRLDHDVHSA
jgi:hypothetical protein